mgnify:CR=1 FL=1
MPYPETRLRRLRQHPAARRMLREHRIAPDNLVLPLFVHTGSGERREIRAMPGVSHHSPDMAAEAAAEAFDAGVPAVLLFGVPDHKDATGSDAWAEDGPVCHTIEAIKRRIADIYVFTDVCLCAYTVHGHCGVLAPEAGESGRVDNDATLPVLARMACAHARAGADAVAPSDMMDGRVRAIRRALDDAGFADVAIMSYSAKCASAFYGPFREAADSAPRAGDRSGYQMDPANAREAMREIALDIEEGADIVMVKPAMPCLDIIHRAAERFDAPIAAYQVSGEYAMIKAAAARGWMDEKRAVLESLTAIRRAGAQIIISYWAAVAAHWLAR